MPSALTVTRAVWRPGWRPGVTVRVSPLGVGVVGQHAVPAAIVDVGVLVGRVGVVDRRPGRR